LRSAEADPARCIYKDFQMFSRERDRSASELIRDIKGEIFGADHDVLEEMLDE
jgi:hypothetical protein